MTEDTVLLESFGTVAKRYGYRKTEAEYTAHKDFKIAWSRTYDTIKFMVSDYVMDAPKEVLVSLADTVCSKITNSAPVPYTKEMMDWVTSDDFVRNKQPIYLRRSRNITKDPAGSCRDLNDSLRRLKDMGLVKEDDNPFLTWTKNELLTHVGYYSSLMNVIAISCALDSEDVPDDVVDYVVYNEYLQMKEGLILFGKESYFNKAEVEQKYPGKEEAAQWVYRMGLDF